jgi:hypothetical protein
MKLLNKATLTLLTALSLSTLSDAQSKWSSGYQAGLGTLNLNSSKIALTNQGFINRKISRRIEIEAALGFTSWNEGRAYRDLAGWPTGYSVSRYTCNLTISAKYYWLQKKTWALYIPLAVSNAYIHMQSKFAGDYNPFEWMVYNEGHIYLAYCLSSGLGGNINLSKHFYLNTQFSVGLKTRKAFGSFETRNATDGNTIAYGGQAGIGYRF